MKSVKSKFGRWRESCWRYRIWWISVRHKRCFKNKNYVTALFSATRQFIQLSQFDYPHIQILYFTKHSFTADFLCHYFFDQPFFSSSIFNKNQSFKIRRQYVFQI